MCEDVEVHVGCDDSHVIGWHVCEGDVCEGA